MVSVLGIQCLKVNGGFVFRDIFRSIIILVIVERKTRREGTEDHSHYEHNAVFEFSGPVKDIKENRSCNRNDIEIRKSVLIEYDLLFVGTPVDILDRKEEYRRGEHIKQQALGHEVFLGIF